MGRSNSSPVQLRLETRTCLLLSANMRISPTCLSYLTVGTSWPRRHGSLLEIYDGNGERTHLIDSDDSFRPVYTVGTSDGNSYMQSGDELRFGFINVRFEGDFIFGLYSGRSRGEAPGRANFGNKIVVFDMNGNVIESFRLDSNLIAIRPDERNNRILGIRHDPSPAIVSYGFDFDEYKKDM